MTSNQRLVGDEVPGPEPPLTATGLVLAGGRSERFGSDKSKYKFEGVELRTRVGKILKLVTGRTLLSTAEPEVAPEPFDAVVVDRFVQCGPLAGLQAGMVAAYADWLVVAPCDMPFVTQSVLSKMLEMAHKGSNEAVVAAHGGRLIGVLGCYSTKLLGAIERRLESHNTSRSVDAFLRSLDHVETLDVSVVVATNVNFTDDIG